MFQAEWFNWRPMAAWSQALAERMQEDDMVGIVGNVNMAMWSHYLGSSRSERGRHPCEPFALAAQEYVLAEACIRERTS